MRADKQTLTSFEWPTLVVLAACYIAWCIGTASGDYIGGVPAWVITSLAIALHSSLQHEALHGHPFRNKLLNEALVYLPLGLAYPYRRFKQLHLAHHRDERLTDPYDDPESNFLDPAVWKTLPASARLLFRANNTLLGRMIIGPALGVMGLYRGEIRKIRDGDRNIRSAYLHHLAGLSLVLIWLTAFGELSVVAYLTAAYAGLSLIYIRTFLEHRAHECSRARTVIVEDRGPLAFLFLNNNFHAVHHAHPRVAWYRLPARYAADRDNYLKANGGYRFRSYWEVFRAYLIRAKDPVPHPLYRSN